MEKRILFIVSTLNTGGINNFLITLLSNLYYDKNLISFLFTIGEGDSKVKFDKYSNNISACLRKSNISFDFSYRISKFLRNAASIFYPFKLFRKIIALKPDVIYSHDHLGDIISPLLIAKILNIKIIFQIHSIENNRLSNKYYLHLVKFLIKPKDVFLFGSNSLKKHYSLLVSKMKKNTEVIYYFVENRGIRDLEKSNRIKSELGIEKNKKIIGFMGRLVKMKNVDTLIKAFSLIKDNNSALLIIGDGPEGPTLMELAKNSGQGDRIYFTGKVMNPEYWINAMDINVLCSDYEGMPITVLESMNKGVVNVCSDIDANKEIIKDEHNGFLFELNNSGMLVLILKKILTDANLYDEVSSNSINYFSVNFDSKKLTREFYNLLFL